MFARDYVVNVDRNRGRSKVVAQCDVAKHVTMAPIHSRDQAVPRNLPDDVSGEEIVEGLLLGARVIERAYQRLAPARRFGRSDGATGLIPRSRDAHHRRNPNPVLLPAIDTEEQIVTVLPPLDEMVNEGLLTHETVEVIAYRSSSTPREAGD